MTTPPRIRVRLPLEGFPRHEAEYVWAVAAESHYRVMSGPFLSDACARGDLIEVTGDGPVREFGSVERSNGSHTERFLFAASVTPEEETERLETLEAYGGIAEQASNRFYSLDVSLDGNRLAVKAQLQFWRKKGWLLHAADREGLFKLAHALADRPLIHWGFSELQGSPALTVSGIAEADEPIQHVVRAAEPPCFQLLPWGTPDESDARVVSLVSMVESDPTLHDLADLPVGWHAWREGKGHAWSREPYQT